MTIPKFSLIPSGKKVDKLYSPLPADGGCDFTYIRTYEGTYTDKDGLIKTAVAGEPRFDYRNTERVTEKNILRFSTTNPSLIYAGGISGVENTLATTPLGNTTERDGGMILDITLSGTISHEFQHTLLEALTVGETYTLSIWIKSAFTSDFQLGYVDNFTAIESINAVPSGLDEWERLTHTFTVPAGVVTLPRIRFNGYSNGNDGETFQLWGMQLEIGDEATDYDESFYPSYKYNRGLLKCPELLMEYAHQNLVKYSNDFSTSWTLTNVARTLNATISPTGEMNGVEIKNTNPSNCMIYQAISCTASTEYTISFWVKLGSMPRNRFRAMLYDETNAAYFEDDLMPYDLKTDEWTRITHTVTTPVGCLSFRLYPFRNNSFSEMEGLTYYLYGAQVELGAVATSYIHNVDNTQNTRALDRVNPVTGVDVTSPDWTVFLDINLDEAFESTNRLSIGDGTTNNNIQLLHIDSLNSVRTAVYIGGSSTGYTYDADLGTIGRRVKVAMVSTAEGYDAYFNGAFAISKTSGRVDTSSYSDIGLDNGTSNYTNGRIREFSYYDTNLSPAELIELTTL